MGRADDNHVAGNNRSGVQSNIGSDRIHHLVGIQAQVDGATITEPGHRTTGLRVKCDHRVPGRNVDDALFLAVGPVRETTPGKLSRGELSPHPLIHAVDPLQFARRSVQRDDSLSRAPR